MFILYFDIKIFIIILSKILGDEIRNRNSLSSCFTSSIEQAKKLGMGGQKFWSFLYESNQIVMLNLEPFAVFFVAAPSANTGHLCNLRERLEPILKDCEQIFREVVSVSL